MSEDIEIGEYLLGTPDDSRDRCVVCGGAADYVVSTGRGVEFWSNAYCNRCTIMSNEGDG